MLGKGTVLSKRYEIRELIGAGGFGSVYRARDRRTRLTVAVKVLHDHLARDAAYLKRFSREIVIARALSSKHVVRVLGSGHDGDIYYCVMEYIQGLTLHDILERDGVLSTRDALAIAADVAAALSEAHSHGIVHRDVKPQNIFVTSGVVKLGDFGIARADDIAPLTVDAGYMGTVATVRRTNPRRGS